MIDGTSGKGVQGCVVNCIRLIYVIKRKSYGFQRVSLPVGGILTLGKNWRVNYLPTIFMAKAS